MSGLTRGGDDIDRYTDCIIANGIHRLTSNSLEAN